MTAEIVPVNPSIVCVKRDCSVVEKKTFEELVWTRRNLMALPNLKVTDRSKPGSDKVKLQPKLNAKNVSVILKNTPCLRDCFIYSTVNKETLQTRRLPRYLIDERSESDDDDYPCSINEETIFDLREILDWIGLPVYDRNMIEDAIKDTSRLHRRNLIADYLGSLEWDGVPRLKTWLTYAFGAEETDLNSFMGTATLVAAVRRGMSNKFYKFDSILYLQGPKDIGKTIGVKELFGEDFFSEELPSLKNEADAARSLSGIWACEVSEGSAFQGVNSNKIKSFVTRSHDRYRIIHSPEWRKVVRRTILVATTNDEDFIKEEPGDRRFWVVPCGVSDKRRTNWIKENRDQLWAEATVLANNPKFKTVVPAELQDALIEVQARFSQRTPLESMLKTFLNVGEMNQVRSVTITELHRVIFSNVGTEFAAASSKAIGLAMRKFGYLSKQVRIKGTTERETVYTRAIA